MKLETTSHRLVSDATVNSLGLLPQRLLGLLGSFTFFKTPLKLQLGNLNPHLCLSVPHVDQSQVRIHKVLINVLLQ